MTTFPPWLHSEPVVRRIASRVLGGKKALRPFLAEVEDYVEGDEALHAKLLLCEPASVARALARMSTWGLLAGDGCFLIPSKPDAAGVSKMIAYQGYRGKAALMQNPASKGMPRLAERVRWAEFYANEITTPFSSDERVPYTKIVEPQKRGALVGSFAEALLPFGRGYLNAALHHTESDKIREDYPTDINTSDIERLPWYGPRCAMHELAKLFPLTALAQKVFNDAPDADDTAFVDDEIPPFTDSPRRVMAVLADVDPFAEMQEVQGRCA